MTENTKQCQFCGKICATWNYWMDLKLCILCGSIQHEIEEKKKIVKDQK